MLNQLILSIFPSVDLGEVDLPPPLKKPRDLPKATWREVAVLRIGSVYLESKHIVMFTKLCCFPKYNPLTWKSTLREWCLARGSAQTVPASGMAHGQYCLLMPTRAAWSALCIKLQKQGDEKMWGKSFGASNSSSLPAADIMWIFSWIAIDPVNYDIVSGKIQLYNMGTDKADSAGWGPSVLLLVHCSVTILRLDAFCS